jgi:hypothetical protein
LEAFEILKLVLISAPCLILSEVASDAMFITVATNASTMGIATVMLQDQGGGLQLVSPFVLWSTARLQSAYMPPTRPV